MIESVTEVNSLEVHRISDMPHVLRMAVVIGLESNTAPLRTLEETALYLNKIGLTDRVLPTSSISFIEQQAFAKLRKNPKIKALYEQTSGLKPKRLPSNSSRRSVAPVRRSLGEGGCNAPSSGSKTLSIEMQQRRAFAAKRREARSEVHV